MARGKLPVLLPPAKRDVKKAYEWYEEQRSGLGDVFLARIEECSSSIARSPKAFQVVANVARRAIVKQFPYVIFYRIESGRVFVYSVFHTSQNPQKWMDRLGD